ncbi:hypothetical protein [uncultured Acinetobacter sp.]|uniref:hypothetical protein n=1 Tax=uncultured Acinetobacter sp. TaxID=165433 RepID=UPI00258D920F|nr:hypothetical protein [uncultured Acinetobacter sp.]
MVKSNNSNDSYDEKYKSIEKVLESRDSTRAEFLNLSNQMEALNIQEYDKDRFKFACQNILRDAFSFFEKNPEYFEYKIGNTDFLSELNRIKPAIIFNERESPEKFNDVTKVLEEALKIFVAVEKIKSEKEQYEFLINELKDQVDQARTTVANLESATLAINGQKTEEIYSEASKTYLTAARNYEVLFYMLIGAALIITVICLAYFPYSEATKVNFIFSKILTATLVITLGTLFLRKAAHLRKLHEQAHQTSLELQALPLYLVNVSTDHQAEIYKDLASKYFGKELDRTQHDKIGDLMQDQLSAGTELIKASAEMVKSVKPSGASESSEPK